MSKHPKLTEEQKSKLSKLEPALQRAVRIRNYHLAKELTTEIQTLLRPTGHETRLMQAKNWLFEAAMEAGELQIAKSGFIGIRKKTSPQTRVYLEATALLGICFLREKDIRAAEPFIAEVFRKDKVIHSERRRRQFITRLIERFEEEGAIAALKGRGTDYLDVNELDKQAGELVQRHTDAELYEQIGRAIPTEVVQFLLKVGEFSRKQLPPRELKFLPSPQEKSKCQKLGQTVFSAFKRVVWKALCDPNSEIYKAWFERGMMFVLNKKYISTAIAVAFMEFTIGIKALAVSFTALVIKLGIEVYCDAFKPEGVMISRNEN